MWRQYYFHTNAAAPASRNRRDVCRPAVEAVVAGMAFDEATFERSAVSFDNPISSRS